MVKESPKELRILTDLLRSLIAFFRPIILGFLIYSSDLWWLYSWIWEHWSIIFTESNCYLLYGQNLEVIVARSTLYHHLLSKFKQILQNPFPIHIPLSKKTLQGIKPITDKLSPWNTLILPVRKPKYITLLSLKSLLFLTLINTNIHPTGGNFFTVADLCRVRSLALPLMKLVRTFLPSLGKETFHLDSNALGPYWKPFFLTGSEGCLGWCNFPEWFYFVALCGHLASLLFKFSSQEDSLRPLELLAFKTSKEKLQFV